MFVSRGLSVILLFKSHTYGILFSVKITVKQNLSFLNPSHDHHVRDSRVHPSGWEGFIATLSFLNLSFNKLVNDHSFLKYCLGKPFLAGSLQMIAKLLCIIFYDTWILLFLMIFLFFSWSSFSSSSSHNILLFLMIIFFTSCSCLAAQFQDACMWYVL